MPHRCRRLTRLAIIILVIAAPVALVGCFGGAHNPGYFPNMIPGGDIIRTHGKPPGRAYFRNFDPKAVCLVVTPAQTTLPTKSQQVLIATVVDKDNQARRGRRVEWMIDGPGNIVEVDESGWTAGRGYKVDNKFAVSYTDYFEHLITRGNNDPLDDFSVAPGQTWCVVSSAVAGETTVTCYAPEVFNWEKSRAFVKINWNDNDFTFPPPAFARYGGEANLNTTIARITEQAGLNANDVKVRYRVINGPPALLINPASGVTEARAGQSELDIFADADGKAPVRVIQPVARQGKTQIAIEVVRPDANGNGPGRIVGRTTAIVEWTAPKLALEVQAPKTAAVDAATTFTYVVSNTGNVESSAASLRAKLPAGIKIETIDPLPTVQNGTEVEWRTQPLAGGQKQEFRVVFKPSRAGTLSTNVIAQTADGLRATADGITEVGTAGIKLTVEQGTVAAMGDRVPVRFLVRNTSTAVPIENGLVRVGLLSQGLEHDTGLRTIELTVGTIQPGQAKTIEVPLIAQQSGRHKILVSVTADGLLNDSAETSIEVRKADLKVAMTGPEQLTPGQEATYEFLVENPGEVAMPNVVLRALPPPALSAKVADSTGRVISPSESVWELGTIAAGERKALKLNVIADRISEKMKFVANVTSTPKSGKPRIATAETLVSVIGMPALTLELAEPAEAVPIGRRAGYRVIVRNRGTGPARAIFITVQIPDEYANVRGTGANREDVRPEGNILPFPVLKELAPGATATFYVEVEGAKVGDARVRAELKADYLTKPLRQEQAARVIDRR